MSQRRRMCARGYHADGSFIDNSDAFPRVPFIYALKLAFFFKLSIMTHALRARFGYAEDETHLKQTKNGIISKKIISFSE